MFGSNKFGQLGLGDFKIRSGVCRVGGVLAGQRVEQLACGDSFTVVATNGQYRTAFFFFTRQEMKGFALK